MTDVWVTMRSCSECLSRHDPDGDLRDCDCWCHDGDACGDDCYCADCTGEPLGNLYGTNEMGY